MDPWFIWINHKTEDMTIIRARVCSKMSCERVGNVTELNTEFRGGKNHGIWNLAYLTLLWIPHLPTQEFCHCSKN